MKFQKNWIEEAITNNFCRIICKKCGEHLITENNNLQIVDIDNAGHTLRDLGTWCMKRKRCHNELFVIHKELRRIFGRSPSREEIDFSVKIIQKHHTEFKNIKEMISYFRYLLIANSLGLKDNKE